MATHKIKLRQRSNITRVKLKMRGIQISELCSFSDKIEVRAALYGGLSSAFVSARDSAYICGKAHSTRLYIGEGIQNGSLIGASASGMALLQSGAKKGAVQVNMRALERVLSLRSLAELSGRTLSDFAGQSLNDLFYIKT